MTRMPMSMPEVLLELGLEVLEHRRRDRAVVAALVAVPDLDFGEALAIRVAGRREMLARALRVEDGLRRDRLGMAGIGGRQDRARRDGEVA